MQSNHTDFVADAHLCRIQLGHGVSVKNISTNFPLCPLSVAAPTDGLYGDDDSVHHDVQPARHEAS